MPAGMLKHTQGYDDNRNYPEQHNNILPGQRITANTEIRQHFTQMRIQCDFEKLCEMYHLRRKELINHHAWLKLIEKACSIVIKAVAIDAILISSIAFTISVR